MFGNPYAERMALESTYEDTATITRAGYQKGDDGFDRPKDGAVYTDIICALSKVNDTSVQTDAQQNIRRDMTLFVSPDKDIRAGDRVADWTGPAHTTIILKSWGFRYDMPPMWKQL